MPDTQLNLEQNYDYWTTEPQPLVISGVNAPAFREASDWIYLC